MMINNKEVIWIIINEQQRFKRYAQVAKYEGYSYLFSFDCNWEFTDEGYIKDSIQLLEQFPRVSQVLLHQPKMSATIRKQQRLIGFSFTPGLHRRQDLIDVILDQSLRLSGSASEQSKNLIQQAFSTYFVNKYMYALSTRDTYVR